jgi:hypothetical protein
MKAWAEILIGIALAVAAEPIHEGGHAIATRLLTGVWPERSPATRTIKSIQFRSETRCGVDGPLSLHGGARSSCWFVAALSGDGLWLDQA